MHFPPPAQSRAAFPRCQPWLAGFSLIEVMCAILILGISLVGLTQGITAALSSSKESELQTTAALIAAAQIELLRAEGYILTGVAEGQGGPGQSLYLWRQSVESTTIDGLFEVAVTVQHSGTGKEIYTLTTLLFDPPILSSRESSDERRDRERSRDQRGRRP
jgi:prepilin-type N-terminal cleavage/methylation domain-containing protein